MLSKKVLIGFIPVVLIILLASFLRFIWVDKVPNAVGGDEIVYLVTAKASFLTGHDIFQKWSPINGLFFKYPKGETQAELPYIIDSFFVGPMPFSLLIAHLPTAIMSTLMALFVYLVAKELLGRRAGILAGLIAAVNPWFIYIGRTAYEGTPAMLFFLVGFWVLLKTKGWRILFSFPFFVLAFYSYIATKLIFLPLIFVFIVYTYLYITNKKYFKQYLVLFLLCIGLVGFFFVSLKMNPSTARLSEILTPFDPAIANEVNAIRKTSIYNPLTEILTNKYTVFANILFTKTLKSFAADYLFVNGDEFFSIWRHGMFYYIDALFMLLGLLFMFAKKRPVFSLFSLLILIGIIPQVFHKADTVNFVIHMTMSIVFMVMLIGYGISETIEYFKNKKIKLAATLIIVALYLISVVNFFNIYIFWSSLQGYFDFKIRTLSSYAVRAEKKGQHVYVYSNASFDFFKKYMFYSNVYTKDTAQTIANNLNNNKHTFGNVTFLSCNKPVPFTKTNNVVIFDNQCGPGLVSGSHLSIALLKDGGEVFQIYNDKVCIGAGLSRYASGITLDDFAMESLSNKAFCEKFITSL